MITGNVQKFCQAVIDGIKRQPFGSMNERELEIILLEALLDSKCIKAEPADMARERLYAEILSAFTPTPLRIY